MSRCLAIYWDQSGLRIATAEIGDRVRVDDLASFALVDSNDQAAITDLVSRYVAREGLARADASVVIGRGQLEFRVIELPFAPDEELPDLVRYQAKSHFSAASEGQVIDFIRLVNGKDTSPIQVLAAALNNAEIKKIQSIVEPSKVRVRHVLPRPFALANLLRNELTAPKYHLLINRMGQETDLTVTYRSRVVFTRTIRLPAEPAEQSQVLVTEIRRTAAAAANQPSGGPIHKILILGDTRSHQEFARVIEQQLQLPIEIRRTSDLVSLASAASKAMGDDDGSFAPLFGSLGLAAEPAEHLIDFALPHRRKEAVQDPHRKYKIGAIAAGIGLVLLSIVWFTIGQRRGEFQRLQAQLGDLSANSESRDLLIGKVELIDRWKQGDVNWLEELYEISARFPLPDEAIVTQLSTSVGTTADEGKINLTGMVSEPKVDNDMVQKLRERPYRISLGKTSPLSDNKTYSRSFGAQLSLPLSIRNVDQLLQLDAKKPVEASPGDEQPSPSDPNPGNSAPANSD